MTLDCTNAKRWYLSVIKTFKCRDTEALFDGARDLRFRQW
jgi:hypothetical protein